MKRDVYPGVTGSHSCRGAASEQLEVLSRRAVRLHGLERGGRRRTRPRRPRDAKRWGQHRGRGHRPEEDRTADRRSDQCHQYFRGRAAQFTDRTGDRPRRDGSQRRHQGQHPRRPVDHHRARGRPRRLFLDQQFQRWRLCGRRLPRLLRGDGLQALRSAADRCAERTAGHPLWPQRHGRRHQHHLGQALDQGLRRRPDRGLWELSDLRRQRHGQHSAVG